ncbi:FemAB family XrtA/PEP-CTERM system-associated protein [Teredinibacter purpureus]|uniref:FemAB family XrtA/PEP-CTERM system-associated protein n=1 Tax=Teredinibacter purpureus TaxID=2731756 RepID=UPI000698CC77|nr:FemAB family XrtA/PEP-CTERM system-associated protein [Teredinibacter purpureus]
MKLTSLPVSLDSLDSSVDDERRKKIVDCNLRFEENRNSLKTLKEQKGILSRKIGAAKKAGEDNSALIAEMKAISGEVKAIELMQADQKRIVAEILSCIPEVDNTPSVAVLPGHFCAHNGSTENADAKDCSFLFVDDSMAERWNTFVDQHERACIYHRYEFRQIITKSFGHHALYIAALNAAGVIVGVLPAIATRSQLFGHYITSIPMFNYCGALGQSLEIEQKLITFLAAAAQERAASHIEMRDTQPREGLKQKTAKFSMVLSLPNTAEALASALGAKVRSQIKKSEENSLQFSVGGIELVDDFYRVFAENMRDLGTPVYSKSFFITLLENTSIKSNIVVVYREGQPVSCGFLLNYKGTMEIPWASTLRSANRLNANMFMYWNILKFAITEKQAFFDFGRSSKDAGTYRFKLQWGATPVQLYWHYWLNGGGEMPEVNPNNPKYRLVIGAWKCLPVWLTKIIGPILAKNLP